MGKIIIFLVTLQLFLFGSFLQIGGLQLKTVDDMFGKKAVLRVKYMEKAFQKIEQEQFSYTKIYMVNTLINKLLYKKDEAHWKNDRSSTFLEFIASGAGDSLDFAVAKYLALVNLGFDKNRFQFFQTDIEGINKQKYHTKDYYILAYTPKSSKKYVLLDCYTDKIIPAFKDKLKLKPTSISFLERRKMEQEMLQINFVQEHSYLNTEINN